VSKASLKPGWRAVKLGDVVNYVRDRVRREETGLEYYLGGEHFDKASIHVNGRGIIASNPIGPAFHMRFKSGQTLLVSRNPHLRKASIAEFEGICADTTYVCEAVPQILLPELLPFLMQTDAFWEHAERNKRGSTNPYLNWSDFASFEFALPPMQEQRCIAELLWAADEAVEKCAALAARITQYSEKVIESSLTSGHFDSVLGDYCARDGIRIGPFGSLLHAEEYRPHGVPVVMPADVQDGVINEEAIAHVSEEKAEELKNYRLCENDILFSRRGDLTKRALVQRHQTGWLCGTGTIRVRLRDGVNARAAYLAVTSDSVNRWLTRFSVGTTMPNLNAATISRIPLHLPDPDTAVALVNEIYRVLSLAQAVKEHQQSISRVLRALAEAATMEEM